MRLSSKAKRRLLIGLGTAFVALSVVWLLRWKILEARVRAELSKVASELFDADIRVGTLRGSLVTSIEAEDVVLEPRPNSPFREFTIKRLQIGYGLLGKGTLDVRMWGALFAFAESKSDTAADMDEYVRTGREITRFRFPGRLQANDSVLALPGGGPRLRIETGEIDYGTWRLTLSPTVVGLKGHIALHIGRVEAELEPGRLSLLENVDGGLVIAARWTRDESHLEISWGRPDADYLLFHGRIEPELDIELSARLHRLDSPLMRAIATGLPLEGGEADLRMTLEGPPEAPTIDGRLVFLGLTIGTDRIDRLEFPLAAEPGALILPRTTHDTPVGPMTLEARVPFPWVKRSATVAARPPPVPPDQPEPMPPDGLPEKRPDILPPTGMIDPPRSEAKPDAPTATLEFPNVEGFRLRLPEEIRPWIPAGRAKFSPTVTPDGWKVMARFEGELYDFPDPVGLLTSYEVEAELTPTALLIHRLKGMLGDGPVEAHGSLDLTKPGAPLILDLKGSDLLIVSSDLARVRINPDVQITVNAGPEIHIAGRVEIPLALYYTEFGPPTPEGGRRRDTSVPFGLRLLPAEGGGFRIPGIRQLDRVTLDVQVFTKDDGECRIENSMIGAIVEGQVRLRGPATNPGADGTVKVIKGQVRLTSGLFLKIIECEAYLPSGPGEEPLLQFEGKVGRFDREILVFLNGPMANPALRLQSRPPRSQEELLSMIAFGRTPGSLEGGDALGALTGKLMSVYADAWPQPDDDEGFFGRIGIDVVAGAAYERPVPPWELPTRGTSRGTMVRTEYLLNEYLSIVAESDTQANLSGDLKLRLRFR